MKQNTRAKLRPFLSLRDAAFRLGDRLVFERTSWNFQPFEHWGIVGANGSGKSLFADAVRGRLPLVHGELDYGFRPSPGLSAEESIGHVSFENRKLEDHGTVVQSRWNSVEKTSTARVREFLSYERVMEINPFEVTEGRDRTRLRFEKRMRGVIRLLGLTAFLDRHLISLSNGETQRVQLARALCHPLKLLILDEPFVGLDTASREGFHRLLDRLMRTRLRILTIATRVEDLPRGITHLLWVESCWVKAAGPRAEIMALPQVRRFLANSATRRQNAMEPGKVNAKQSEMRRSRTSQEDPESGRVELVRLRDVTVQYGDAVILRELSWTIWAGESWALLGPNGSGKTTLLSLILGDNPQAYQNEVVVFGRRRGEGESIWEIKRKIGWVSPDLQQHFDDSVSCLDVVISGFMDTIGVFEPPNARQRAAGRAELRRFRLLRFADSPLYELSAGIQRMVLLARALVKKPSLLILDEPCQGLDPQQRKILLDAVEKVIRAGSATAIFVTHRADEIPSSVRRVLRLTHRSGVS